MFPFIGLGDRCGLVWKVYTSITGPELSRKRVKSHGENSKRLKSNKEKMRKKTTFFLFLSIGISFQIRANNTSLAQS